jgi:hypothetical protein
MAAQPQHDPRDRTTDDDPNRDSGQPGGGKGRTDAVGRTGVYPGSGPYPSGEAEVRTPGSFVHSQVDDQGRPVEGRSDVTTSIGNESQGGVE